MSTKFKTEQLIVGPGNMNTNAGTSVFRSGTTDPNASPPTDTKDGDVYMRVNGANSDLLIQVSGVYVSLRNAPQPSTLADGVAGQVWGPIILPVSSVKFLLIDYSVQRGVGYQQGTIKAITDETDVVLVSSDINEVGTNVDVTFDAVNASGFFNLLCDTGAAQGTGSVNVKYTIRSWG